jgi:hypothetical protein
MRASLYRTPLHCVARPQSQLQERLQPLGLQLDAVDR